MKKKRGYSRAFTPRGAGKRYTLDSIPAGLWTQVREQCRRNGVSIRSVILTLLTQWTSQGRNDGHLAEDRAAAALFSEALAGQRRAAQKAARNATA